MNPIQTSLSPSLHFSVIEQHCIHTQSVIERQDGSNLKSKLAHTNTGAVNSQHSIHRSLIVDGWLWHYLQITLKLCSILPPAPFRFKIMEFGSIYTCKNISLHAQDSSYISILFFSNILLSIEPWSPGVKTMESSLFCSFGM